MWKSISQRFEGQSNCGISIRFTSLISQNMLLAFIERNLQKTKVKLTGLGRENCAMGIDIPRSDIQRLGDYLGE